MASWDDVRALALALPEVEESTSWGKLAFRVRGKWFAGEGSHKEGEGAVVLRCDGDERPLMLAARPDVFWVTPHYHDPRYVLVRVDAIDRDELAERLADAWALAAPKSLRAR